MTAPAPSSLFANRWRTAFFLLLAAFLLLLILLASCWLSLTRPATQAELAGTQASAVPAVPVQATISLAALNQLADSQIAGKETPLKNADISFEGERVRLDASLAFFGRMMDLNVLMRPEVLPNGDLRLLSEEAKIGRIAIPQKTLFSVLEGLPWPPWIRTQAEGRRIDFKFSEQPGPYACKVEGIDWEQQSISMEVRLAQ